MPTRRSILIGSAALALAGAGGTYAAVRHMGTLGEYDASVAGTRAALQQTPAIAGLVRYATLAPSGHNTQPWIFSSGGSRIAMHPDLSRRTPAVDPDDHHLFVSLGCAAENLALACAASGRPGDIQFDPANGGSAVFVPGGASAAPSPLFAAIPLRQSTRGIYDGKPAGSDDLAALAAAAAGPGVDLVLVTDRRKMDQIRDLVIAGNSTQMADGDFRSELLHWMRFSPGEALRTGDGLFTATTGNPVLPAWLGPAVFDLAFRADTENSKYARQINSSAGIAIFVAQQQDHEHWMLAGRACQRFALQATALGIRHAFINQPVEVAALRPELANLIAVPGRRPDLVMRFGFGPALPFSARRPVAEVMTS